MILYICFFSSVLLAACSQEMLAWWIVLCFLLGNFYTGLLLWITSTYSKFGQKINYKHLLVAWNMLLLTTDIWCIKQIFYKRQLEERIFWPWFILMLTVFSLRILVMYHYYILSRTGAPGPFFIYHSVFILNCYVMFVVDYLFGWLKNVPKLNCRVLD